MGKPATITFRLDADKKDALDSIATSLDRDRSYILNEAVDHYLDLHQWQIEQIKQGLREAKSGKFVPEAEMDAFFAKADRELAPRSRKRKRA